MTAIQYTPENVGVVDLATLASMSGLEFLQAIARGELPGPPIAKTLGFNLAEVEEGRAVFISEPGLHHYNPIGTVHAGFTATLLDSCMACAVQSTLPERDRLHDDGVQDLAIAARDERDRPRPRRGHIALPRPSSGDGGRSPDRCARQIAGARDDDVPDLRVVIEVFRRKPLPGRRHEARSSFC